MRVIRTESGREALRATRVLVVIALVGMLGSGCASNGASSSASGAASSPSATSAAATAPPPAASPTPASGCRVGVAWHNFAEERLARFYQPQIEKAVEAAGGFYTEGDAKSSPEEQARIVENLRNQGANVLITIPHLQFEPGWSEMQQAMRRATDAGIPVIALEGFVDQPKVLNIGFDQVEIGRQEARAIIAQKPTGNYVIFKGPAGSVEADWITAGIREVLKPAIDSGAIKIADETAVENWDPVTAQFHMSYILGRNNIDAVIAESDEMAGGAMDSIKEAGLLGKTLVAGQDGDVFALNRVALGSQAVSVWSDLQKLGAAVSQAAVALCRNPDVNALAGVKPVTWPNGDQAPSILLAPQTITRDNLNLVLDSGWISKEWLCRDVYADLPPACR